ncbi:MAG: hypothetical protein QXN55_01415 [Candidatus Nitrosotenuis sp.]
MLTLQILQEASQTPLADLKKEISKNSIVKVLFKKDLSIADIPDPAKFIATIKFLLLNNDNVVQFVKSRAHIKSLQPNEFNDLRTMTVDNLDTRLGHLKLFVDDLFREFNFTEKSNITPETKKELKDWINSNGRYFKLSSAAIRELKTLKGLKPDQPIRLYRGVLFTKYDLEQKNNYDGTMYDGNGLRFLKQIKANERTIELDWERPSSWTTDLKVAERFAKYGPANSSFEATYQWLGRDQKKIDGELGYVISTLAHPNDVLFMTDKLNVSFHFAHGNESEVVLAPGMRLARVVKKYTVEGEVDPVEHAQLGSKKKAELTDKISVFKENFNASELLDSFADFDVSSYEFSSFNHVVRNEDLLKRLSSAKLTNELNALLEKWLKFAKNIANANKAALTNTDDAEKIQALKNLISAANESTRSKNSKTGEIKYIDLQSNEVRSHLGSFYELKNFEREASSGKPKIEDRGVANLITDLYQKITGEEAPPNFSRFGSEKQAHVIVPVIDYILSITDPSTKIENRYNSFFNAMRRLYRNIRILKILSGVLGNLEKI